MKKLFSLLLSVLLILLTITAASANSWGLPNGLQSIVSGNSDYDNYTSIADDYSSKQTTAHFVMQSRYHHQLFAARKSSGKWAAVTVSTIAVYQPGDTDETPKLTRTENGFEMSYKKRNELYRFELSADASGNDVYTLVYAEMGDVRLTQTDSGYDVTLDGETACWNAVITLDTFNISQMPHRGPEDVRRMNEMVAGMQYMANLTAADIPAGKDNGGKMPVYSAPDESAYRASKGKAAVDLNGGYRYYGSKDGWSMVEYSISLRTSRIGWIHDGSTTEPYAGEMVNVPIVTVYDTFLTDDPNVGQYVQTSLPAGTQLTAGTRLEGNKFYVYAEGTVNGQRIGGFVPARDIAFDDVLMDETPYVGSWFMDGGSEICSMYLTLSADGTFSGTDDADSLPEMLGTWSVVQNDADSGLYWSGCTATIVLAYSDGTYSRFGVSLDTTDGTTRLSFYNSEGGCGYIPAASPTGTDEITNG